MDLATAFQRQKPLRGLIGVEKLAMIYGGMTLLLGLMYLGLIDNWTPIVALRVALVAGTFILWRLYKYYPCNATYVLRVVFQIALLGYWYPDIYNFVRFQPNLDHLFAVADQEIFGCQPAIMLSKWLSGPFWSELFNLGYFSYYLMIIVIVLWALCFHYRRFDKTTVILLCSFLLYYMIFLFLQSAGPQFYFQKIGLENVEAAHFPHVGDWFRYHSELVHESKSTGLFSYWVQAIQGSERPIAAFPSSHVGLGTVIMILAYKMSKKLCLAMAPFYAILCVATVYIGAHYVVDVYAGWITAFIFYWLSEKIYYTKFIHRSHTSAGEYHRHHHHHQHLQD